jgi:hypothetical protein
LTQSSGAGCWRARSSASSVRRSGSPSNRGTTTYPSSSNRPRRFTTLTAGACPPAGNSAAGCSSYGRRSVGASAT